MRLAKWDNLKFVLMYCVVFGHFVNNVGEQSTLLRGLWLFVYLFDIPAFLFISGLFSKKTIDGRRYDKMLPYLYLYLFMKLFRFVVYSLVKGEASSFHFFSEGGVPWFALMLFLSYLVTTWTSSLKKSYVLLFAFCLGMIAGYDSDLGSFLVGMRFFTFYPFFLLGYCIPVEKLTAWTERKTVKIMAGVVLVAVLIACFVFMDQLYGFRTFLKGKSTYASLGLLPYGGLYRGVYYILVLVLIFCVIAVTPNVKCIISAWGQRTIQVFALHYPIIYVLMQVFHFDEFLMKIWPAHYGWLVPFAAFALTAVLSLKVWSPFFHWLMKPGLAALKAEDTRKM